MKKFKPTSHSCTDAIYEGLSLDSGGQHSQGTPELRPQNLFQELVRPVASLPNS